MNKKEKLPIFGVGPMFVIICLILTVLGIYLNNKGMISNYSIFRSKILIYLVSGIFIILGITLWIWAVIIDKIGKDINNNKLKTTGVYSIVRNPIYSAFIFLFTGIIISLNNMYLLIIPVIFYIFVTVLMKKTEEEWLREKFGEEYLNYCNHVNRVIPWIKKK